MPSRSSLFVWGSFALGCSTAATQTPDRPSPDVALEAAVDATADLPSPDATPACDPDGGAFDGSAVTGYLRFANLTRGAGTLRFTARSLPGFREAFIEAVVPEGTASLQAPTLAVAYEIRVAPAAGQDAGIVVDVSNSDAGMLTDGPAAPPTPCDAAVGAGEFAPPACTDVYSAASCTVVLAGSPTGATALRQERRLWRFPDLATRGSDCALGQVRVVHWYVGGPLLNVDTAAAMPIARNAAYSEATGARLTPAGVLRVAVRSAESMENFGVLPAGTVLGTHTMTLHLWGDAQNTAQRAPAAILLDDLPPTR